MQIIQPYVLVDKFDPGQIMRALELRGRVCYKSEDKITPTSAEKFVAGIVKSGHLSVIEHEKISVRIVCDRGVSHEIVRHRIASYSQESTRYVNYEKNGMVVIEPFFFHPAWIPRDEKDVVLQTKYSLWYLACKSSEMRYNELIQKGCTPQEARSVLPNSLKTEIEVTFNLREWRHFFTERCSHRAHPQLQQIAIPLLLYFRERLPVIFAGVPHNEKFPENFYAEVKERCLT